MDYSNYNLDKEETWCSWPIILFALYVFFPLGIFLIIKKQKLHRRNIFTIGQKTSSTAISLIVFGLLFYIPQILYIYMQTFSKNADIKDLHSVVDSKFYSTAVGYGNIFIILGVIILFISFYQKYKGKKYQKYISLIVNKDKESLVEIASIMQLRKEKVEKDLETMINKRYLQNYELDLENNRIYNVLNEKRKAAEKIKNTRVVQCPNCHANNKLCEKIGKCEYCNSYIE